MVEEERYEMRVQDAEGYAEENIELFLTEEEFEGILKLHAGAPWLFSAWVERSGEYTNSWEWNNPDCWSKECWWSR